MAQFRILGKGVEHPNVESVGHLGSVLLAPQLAAPLKGHISVPSDQGRDLQVLVEQRVDDIRDPSHLRHLGQVFAKIFVYVAVVEHDRLLPTSTGDEQFGSATEHPPARRDHPQGDADLAGGHIAVDPNRHPSAGVAEKFQVFVGIVVEHLHGVDDVQPDLLDQVVAGHRAVGRQRADDLYGVGPNPGRSQFLKDIGQEPKSRRRAGEVVNQDGRRRPAASKFAQGWSADSLLQCPANAGVADIRSTPHVVNRHFPVIGELHFERSLAVPSGPRDENFLHDFPPSPSP